MDEAQQTRVYTALVGADNTEAGDEAVRQAAQAARSRGMANLHVVHVLESKHEVMLATMREVTVAPTSEVLESAASALRARVHAQLQSERCDQLSLAFHVRHGDAADELVRAASEFNADLLVVGTPPRQTGHRSLGSVAELVVRTASCPVLIARRKVRRSDSR